ncbi:hypothetical protein FRX31_002399, partial [Thalictrum thalictroides]
MDEEDMMEVARFEAEEAARVAGAGEPSVDTENDGGLPTLAGKFGLVQSITNSVE